MNVRVLNSAIHIEYLDDSSNRLISLTTENEQCKGYYIKKFIQSLILIIYFNYFWFVFSLQAWQSYLKKEMKN